MKAKIVLWVIPVVATLIGLALVRCGTDEVSASGQLNGGEAQNGSGNGADDNSDSDDADDVNDNDADDAD